MEHSEFHLEENEKIVDVEVCYGKMINMLTFWTNKKDDNSEQRCYGPYGDDFGSRECHWEVPEGSCGFLAGVAGAVVNSQEATVITRLQFAWQSYRFILVMIQGHGNIIVELAMIYTMTTTMMVLILTLTSMTYF